MKIRSAIKYKGFPIQKGNKISLEENLLSKYADFGKIEISDITLTEGARQEQNETQITVLQISELDFTIPDFALEPEGLWSKLFEGVSGKDIDFNEHPEFSKMYYLRGDDELAVRNFFSGPVIKFLESHDEMHIECHKNRLLVFKKRDLMTPEEIESEIKFSETFVEVAAKAKSVKYV